MINKNANMSLSLLTFSIMKLKRILVHIVKSIGNYFHFWLYSWVEYEQIIERKPFLLEHGTEVELGRLQFQVISSQFYLDFLKKKWKHQHKISKKI